jgi:hypothetical protein
LDCCSSRSNKTRMERAGFEMRWLPGEVGGCSREKERLRRPRTSYVATRVVKYSEVGWQPVSSKRRQCATQFMIRQMEFKVLRK